MRANRAVGYSKSWYSLVSGVYAALQLNTTVHQRIRLVITTRLDGIDTGMMRWPVICTLDFMYLAFTRIRPDHMTWSVNTRLLSSRRLLILYQPDQLFSEVGLEHSIGYIIRVE